MGKNVSLDLTGEFAVKGAAISSNSKLPDGATELLKDHVGDLNQHVNAAIKQLLNALIAGATNNATISIDSVTGLRELLNAVSGAFAFQGECTAEELAEKEKVAGHVWQVGDKEFACNGTDWVELGFNIDLSSYALASDLTDHVGNSDIHVTEEDKASWNAKVDSSAFETALAGKVDASVLPQYLKDYSAFEVWATDEAIPAETTISGVTYYDSGVAADFINDVTTNFEISAGMTESFKIRSYHSKSEQDILIDFGDGTVQALSELDDSKISISNKTISGVSTPYEYGYTIQHTYTEPNKVYQIRIYGSTYFGIQATATENVKDNLICRVLEKDLPIASHVTNLASLCRYSQRLFRVIMPAYALRNNNFTNISNLFMGTPNLKTAFGLDKFAFSPINIQNMFSGCYSLTQCDFRLPAVCNAKGSDQPIKYVFENCRSLNVDINDLLPLNGFLPCTTQSAAGIFKNCSLLTGTVPADQLWDNPNITWINTSDCFSGCSVEIRNQVPESWGGLLAPDSDQGTDDL